MTRIIHAVLLAPLAVALPLRPAIAQRGTPAEAQAMLAKAVAHYRKVGRAQALADFTAKKAPFVDRDLYVVCIGPDRVISAHGAAASYVGASPDLLKDAEGKPLGKAIFDAADKKGGGSVRYRWVNPVSGKVEPKVSFVERVGTDVCLVGAYEGS
ncbi:MAG TPA: cache domain-containing protein [Gemmatimonadales bacterium]